jgi:hypothetical protein
MTVQNDKKDLIIGYSTAFIASFVVAYLSFDRSYFTFSTETDFIARNLVEAQRFLKGEPLLLEFHPPFYSIILALFYYVTRDWLTAGLVVSWMSSAVVLMTSFGMFHRIGGRFAAWGSLAGLMSSQLFLTYSSFATQDMFFLALYSACIFLVLLAMTKGSGILWGGAGAVLGCALLTRANAISLLVLLAFPWFQPRTLRDRVYDFSRILVACSAVIALWGLYAHLTGSPFGTRYGHLNLAMRYFSEEGDPFTVEARHHLMSKFSGYKEVLLHDPKDIAVTYAKDSVQYLKRNLVSSELLTFPFMLFSLPGIFFLFFQPAGSFPFLFFLATVLQIGLLGFKEYEPRFYLFMVPVLAAGAGVCLQSVWIRIPKGWKRAFALIIFLPIVVSGVKETKYALLDTYEDLHAQDKELEEVLSTTVPIIDPSGIFVSRKEHIPFYMNIRHAKFPDMKNMKEFRAWIEHLPEGKPVYVYFGSDEKRSRSRLGELSFRERAPDWLEPLAQSRFDNAWILYSYDPDASTDRAHGK